MSDSSRKEATMREQLIGLSELRLILHCYPQHATAALITRRRNGSENWDRRAHAWDLRVPQSDYAGLLPTDQLWVLLGELSRTTNQPRETTWAEPPAPPVGGHRGHGFTQPVADWTT